MSLKTLGKVSYFSLNNEINRPVNGQIPLHKDIEARDAFYKENVEPNTMKFKSFSDKLDYLVENDYIEREILDKYSHSFIIELYTHLKSLKFQFKSFMAMYKFYAQYALKTNDGKYYLENYEERVLFNALAMADGDEQLAKEMAEEILYQRYQPATPTYLNLGRKRRGELVSCYLLAISDDLNSIGRAVNSALQLSKLGGGVSLSLSDLREAGSPIKGIENAASGVCAAEGKRGEESHHHWRFQYLPSSNWYCKTEGKWKLDLISSYWKSWNGCNGGKLTDRRF